MSLNPKAIVTKNFIKVEGDEAKWRCTCGKVLTQKVNTGYSNLVSHVRNNHPDWLQQQLSAQPTIIKHTTTSTTKNAKNMYGWLEWVCLEWVCVGLKPFSFVEDEHTKKYTNLAPITVPTLKKYMDKVTKAVELKIAEQLPERFTLAIDGWTKGTTHFVAIFASYPHEDTYATALLTFTPLGRRAELHR